MTLTTCLPRGWLGDEGFPLASDCPCGLTGAPSERHRPGCDRTVHPQVDEETLALVNAAVESLARRRGSAPPTARRRYCGYVRWVSGLASGGA